MASFYEGDPEDDDMADHSVQGTERLGQPEASHSEQMGSGHITSKKKSAKKPANSRFVVCTDILPPQMLAVVFKQYLAWQRMHILLDTGLNMGILPKGYSLSHVLMSFGFLCPTF